MKKKEITTTSWLQHCHWPSFNRHFLTHCDSTCIIQCHKHKKSTRYTSKPFLFVNAITMQIRQIFPQINHGCVMNFSTQWTRSAKNFFAAIANELLIFYHSFSIVDSFYGVSLRFCNSNSNVIYFCYQIFSNQQQH